METPRCYIVLRSLVFRVVEVITAFINSVTLITLNLQRPSYSPTQTNSKKPISSLYFRIEFIFWNISQGNVVNVGLSCRGTKLVTF